MRTTWVLLWLPTIVILAGCRQNPALAKAKYFDRGNRYFDSKQYAEATLEYGNAVRLDPGFGEARFKLAESYRALGNMRAAFPEYVRAADLLPERDDAQLTAGNLLVNGGRFQEAKERARVVLRRDANNVAALVLLGNSLAGLKDLDEGIGVLGRAVQLEPEGPSVYANLGVFQLAQGDPQPAEEAFTKAVAVAPKSVDAYLNLANFYRAVHKSKEAEETFQRALEVEPKSVKAYDGLAALYMETGRQTLAEPFFKTLVELGGDERARIALSGYYVSVGRFPDAFKTLEDLATSPKYFAAAKIRIAMLHYATGKHDRAHQVIDEVIAREPRNGQALTVKARLLLADQSPRDALERVKHAVLVDPRLADAHLVLARVQLALNDVEEARKAFNDTLALDPRSLAAQLELSELHRNRNEIDTAVQFAEQAIATSPGNVAARLTLVRALMVRDHDRARAEEELRAVLAKHPTSARSHGVMAQLLLLRNDLNGAQQSFMRELALDRSSVEAVTGLVAVDLYGKRRQEARTRLHA